MVPSVCTSLASNATVCIYLLLLWELSCPSAAQLSGQMLSRRVGRGAQTVGAGGGRGGGGRSGGEGAGGSGGGGGAGVR